MGNKKRKQIIQAALKEIDQDYGREATETTGPREYVIDAICQLYDKGLMDTRKIEGELNED